MVSRHACRPTLMLQYRFRLTIPGNQLGVPGALELQPVLMKVPRLTALSLAGHQLHQCSCAVQGVHTTHEPHKCAKQATDSKMKGCRSLDRLLSKCVCWRRLTWLVRPSRPCCSLQPVGFNSATRWCCAVCVVTFIRHRQPVSSQRSAVAGPGCQLGAPAGADTRRYCALSATNVRTGGTMGPLADQWVSEH